MLSSHVGNVRHVASNVVELCGGAMLVGEGAGQCCLPSPFLKNFWKKKEGWPSGGTPESEASRAPTGAMELWLSTTAAWRLQLLLNGFW